jgi:predicted nucleic acid-binding protein
VTRPLAVIDTNVVVSGLLTGDASSPVARILDGMLGATFPFALSPDLLAEYLSVLLRPKIRQLHGLGEEEIDRILRDIVIHAVWREPAETVAAPDLNDQHVWRLLNAQRGSVLVTGDRLLLDNPPDFASLISPRSFVERLQSGQ